MAISTKNVSVNINDICAYLLTAFFGAGMSLVGVRVRIVRKISSLEKPRLLRSIVVAPNTMQLCEPQPKASRKPAVPVFEARKFSHMVLN